LGASGPKIVLKYALAATPEHFQMFKFWATQENKKQFLEFEIFEYVSEWLTVHKSTTNTPQELEEVLDIFRQLVVVQLGGFSTMLDSYRNKQTQPLPKQ